VNGWLQSVWPVTAFFLGGAAKYAGDALQVRRQDKRDNAARADRLAERRESFELTTLTDLHAALGDLMRATVVARFTDMWAHAQTEQHAATRLTEERAEKGRLANQQVHALSSLVLDEEIRSAVERAQLLLGRSVLLESNPDEVKRAHNDGVIAGNQAQDMVASRIREIYLAIEPHAPRKASRL
jgi:hypothetical protein